MKIKITKATFNFMKFTKLHSKPKERVIVKDYIFGPIEQNLENNIVSELLEKYEIVDNADDKIETCI